jgi:hypothetical protein
MYTMAIIRSKKITDGCSQSELLESEEYEHLWQARDSFRQKIASMCEERRLTYPQELDNHWLAGANQGPKCLDSVEVLFPDASDGWRIGVELTRRNVHECRPLDHLEGWWVGTPSVVHQIKVG